MNAYHFKTAPYKHQVDALRKMLADPCKQVGGGLPMEMGTGKTKIAIDYACIKEIQGEIQQVLVLAPLSVVGVWDGEIRKHSSSETLAWKATNYDKLPHKHYFDELVSFVNRAPTLLVLDESHKIKNPQAKRTKAALILAQLCVRTLWLSGTSAHQSPLDLFAPMKAIDDAILGGSWAVFKRQYAMWGGYGGYQLIKYMNLKQLRARVDPYIFPMQKKDCLDLPSKTHQIVPVDLRESRRAYDTLARESIAWIEGLEVETPIVLTKLLRLSQLTGGWAHHDDESRRVGNEKLDKFRGLLGDMYEQDRIKVVVFCRFIPELRDICAAAKEIGYRVLPFHGKTPVAQRDRFIAKFEETKDPTVFVAQIDTGSLGITLTAASECIFFSHSYSAITFDQACDRLHRIGQRHPVTYYHMLARDTVDEAVWLSLRTKRKLAQLVMHNPELLT